MSFWIISGILLVGFTVLMTWLSLRVDRKQAVNGLGEVLRAMGEAFGDSDIVYQSGEARWSGTIDGRSVESVYSSNHRLAQDSLAFLIPFSTHRLINYTNTRDYAPFHKKSFEDANEIFLGVIKDDALKAVLKDAAEDKRFVRLTARMRTHELKFVRLPRFDDQHRVVNDTQEKATDTLSIRISVPRMNRSNPQGSPVDREFPAAMIRLLYKVRDEIAGTIYTVSE